MIRASDRKRLNFNLLAAVIAVFILVVAVLVFNAISKKGEGGENLTGNLTDNYIDNGTGILSGLFSSFIDGGFVSAQAGNVIYYNNGWVGIGTSNPKQTLNVVGSFNVTGQALFPNSICLSGQALSTTSTGQLSCMNISNVSGGNITGTGTAGRIAFWNSSKSLSSSSNFYWDSSNNRLGIGTDDPTRGKLQVVQGRGTAVSVFSGSASDWVAYKIGRDPSQADDGTWGVASGAGLYSDFATVGDVVLRADTNDLILTARNPSGAIRFGTGASDTEKVTIISSGNVGIGTTSPGTKLDIESGAIELNTMTAPSNPLANTARIYLESGRFDCAVRESKTRLQVKIANADGTSSTITLAESDCTGPQ